MGAAGDGELVYASVAAGVCFVCFAVDYEGVAGVEEDHGFGGERDEVWRIDSHDLCGGSGWVGERADEMEDGADAEGATDGHYDFHRRVEGWCVEEGEAMFSEGGGAVGGGEGYGDVEGFEDVGGTAGGGDGAVAVFGDGGSAAAATRAAAVEMLKVPLASAPVPQVSTRRVRSVSVSGMVVAAARMVSTKPAISAGAGPRVAREPRRAASSRSVDSPRRMVSRSAAASARERVSWPSMIRLR